MIICCAHCGKALVSDFITLLPRKICPIHPTHLICLECLRVIKAAEGTHA